MIFDVTIKFAKTNAGSHLSDFVSSIAHNGHKILVDSASLDIIEKSIDSHASTTEKMDIGNCEMFNIMDFEKAYFTTIQVDNFSIPQLLYLAKLPPLLVVEDTYEFGVYQHLFSTYATNAKSRPIKDLSAHLSKVFLLDNYVHAGGYGAFERILEQKNNGNYHYLLRFKSVTIVDRDTESINTLPKEKMNLIHFLQGSKMDIENDNIYTTNQPNYIWHLWAYREIENYITKAKFAEYGCGVDNLPDDLAEYHYIKIKDCAHRPSRNSASERIGYIDRYNKSDIAKIAQLMTCQDWENSAPKFIIDDREMSEIELLLLKIAKIV